MAQSTNLIYRAEMLSQRYLPKVLFQFRAQDCWQLTLSSELFESNQPECDYSICWAVPCVAHARLLAESGQEWKHRVSDGARAILAIREERLVGLCWFARNQYCDADTGLIIPLASQQAWLFGAWVSRNLRRRGIYRRLLSAAAADLRSEGVDEFLLTTERSNFISRAVHQRFGAVKIGSLGGLRWLGKGGFALHITNADYVSLSQPKVNQL